MRIRCRWCRVSYPHGKGEGGLDRMVDHVNTYHPAEFDVTIEAREGPPMAGDEGTYLEEVGVLGPPYPPLESKIA